MARNKPPEETVNLIVSVAFRKFMEKGYEHTSIQDIIDNLGGMSKGAIYHHFKSKEDILMAVMDRMTAGSNRMLKDIRDRKGLSGKEKLKAIFKEEKYKVNPHVNTACDFINYYTNLVSLTANFGYVLRGICSNQEVAVDNTAAAREQVHGVSSDEELSNMIMFQNAYNASSRYVNVINEMLEHVLSALGR